MGTKHVIGKQFITDNTDLDSEIGSELQIGYLRGKGGVALAC